MPTSIETHAIAATRSPACPAGRHPHLRGAALLFVSLWVVVFAGIAIKPWLRQAEVAESSDVHLLSGRLVLALGAASADTAVLTDGSLRDRVRAAGYDLVFSLAAQPKDLAAEMATGQTDLAVLPLRSAVAALTDVGTIPLVLVRRPEETIVVVAARRSVRDEGAKVAAFVGAYFDALTELQSVDTALPPGRWFDLDTSARHVFGVAVDGQYRLADWIAEAAGLAPDGGTEGEPASPFAFIASRFIRDLYAEQDVAFGNGDNARAEASLRAAFPPLEDWSRLSQVGVLSPAVRFNRGQVVLDDAVRVTVADLLAKFRRYPTNRLLLQAAVPDDGDPGLALDRARAVRRHLVEEAGIDPDRIRIATLTIAPAADEPLRRFHRRLRELYFVVVEGE